MKIRPIEFRDNAAIERIIRECLTEFGGNRDGLAWADDSMQDLFHFYTGTPGQAYWIVELDGKVAGGCGIGSFNDGERICELQKMYLDAACRGTGIAAELLETALDYAKRQYSKCYLETLQNMHAANRFYRKHGFLPLEAPLPGSEHYACDAWYIKSLNEPLF